MLSKIGEYDFTVEPFHCDFQHRLFIGHLGNHMLNAADYHSDERGYGMNFLMKQHRTWVLSRFAIEVMEMPKAYDRIRVSTWVDKVMRYFTSRNFAITATDSDHVYGYGRSIWAMIDTETRQPVDIMAVGDGLIAKYIETERECPMAAPTRVKMQTETANEQSFRAKYSDIDVNGHVNSVKYIDHILDLWNLDWYAQNALRRIDIAYTAEAHCDDELFIKREQIGDNDFAVNITKCSCDAQEAIEVCKSIVKFAKK